MATNYSWLINQMDVKKNVGNMDNVVIQIHWVRKAILNENDKTYTAESYGKTDLVEPLEENFTPYYDLTKEKVSKWLDDNNNVELLDSDLNDMINKQINIYLPWMEFNK
jgi:hypothetical protein